ncbi:MAG: hypothetical protein U9R20_00260 [Thermodesulfobacteriota bacterium]|nr:hypothetical protein [Thermodesulfobacteriota bacterium]
MLIYPKKSGDRIHIIAFFLQEIGILSPDLKKMFLKDITVEKGELSSFLEIKGVFHKVH